MFAEGLSGCTVKHVLMRAASMSKHSVSSSAAGTGSCSKNLSPGCDNWLGKPQKHLGRELSPCAKLHSLCIISCRVLAVLLLTWGWLSPDCILLAKACAWQGTGRACRGPARKPQAVSSVLSPCTHRAEKTVVCGSGACSLLALLGLTAGETCQWTK